MPLSFYNGSIVDMDTRAIVNAANCELREGGGVCGAIFRAAGSEKMRAACKKLGGVATGQAVITPGFALKAEYVIHTAGPVWQGGNSNEEALLYSCYTQALKLAEENGIESIAFPVISAGIYGYPRAEALRVAISSIRDYLEANGDMQVYIVIYDRGDIELNERLKGELGSYLSRNYRGPEPGAVFNTPRVGALMYAAKTALPAQEDTADPDAECHDICAAPAPTCDNAAADYLDDAALQRRLDEALKRVSETFSQMLLRLIDESGRTDAEVYHSANIDRKLFSKIRTNPSYRPKKSTAVALCVALRLDIDRTRDLLARAGYALSSGSRQDVIIQYFIEHGIYDIYSINEALFFYDEQLLGA